MNRVTISDDKFTLALFYKKVVIAYLGINSELLVLNFHCLVDAIFRKNRSRFKIHKIDNFRNIITVKLSGLLL